MFRPIYEPRTRAREYCDLAVNIYTGCNHRCIYCYAPHVLRKSAEEFHGHVAPRTDIVESVRRQIEREKLTGKKIMLCFTCDPYPAEIDTSATRKIIELIKGSGNHVQILTKGGARAKSDFDLLDGNDSFGVTISGSGEYGSVRNAEPGAAPIIERLETLREARAHGIHTWVSCEPVLDPIGICHLIVDADYIDLFRIGKLNYAPSTINWRVFGITCEHLCKLHGRNYYIKDDLRVLMEKTP